GTGAQNRHGGAPGGGRPPLGTQGASLGAWPAPLAQAQRMPRKHPYVSRRSATPRFGCAKQRKQNPGAKTGRGTKKHVLFDKGIRLANAVQRRAATSRESARVERSTRAASSVCSLAPRPVLTLPLVGRVGAQRRGGGRCCCSARCVHQLRPPSPTPPHKGEG